MKTLKTIAYILGIISCLAFLLFMVGSRFTSDTESEKEAEAKSSVSINQYSSQALVGNLPEGGIDADSRNEAEIKKAIALDNEQASVLDLAHLDTDLGYEFGGSSIGEEYFKATSNAALSKPMGSTTPNQLNNGDVCVICGGLSEEDVTQKVIDVVSGMGISGDKRVNTKRKALFLNGNVPAYIDGKAVFLEDGILVDQFSNPILVDGAIVQFRDGEILSNNKVSFTDLQGSEYDSSGQLLQKDPLTKDDLEALTFNGKPVYLDKNNQLRYRDSNAPVLDENNEIIIFDKENGFVNANGKPSSLSNQLKSGDFQVGQDGLKRSSSNQNLLSPLTVENDGTLIGADGKAITIRGKRVKVLSDGTVVDAITGLPVLDNNNNPIKFISGVGLTSGIPGATLDLDSILRDSENISLSTSGRKLVEAGANSNLLSIGDNGKVLDGDRKPVTLRKSEIKITDNNAIVLALDNSSAFDKNKIAIRFNSDLGLITPNGINSFVDGELRDSKGRLITSNGHLLTVEGLTPNKMNLSNDGKLLDGKGGEISIRGQRIKVLPDGTVVDYYTKKPILDLNNRPIHYDPVLGFVNDSNEPSSLAGILKDSTDSLLSSSGGELAPSDSTNNVIKEGSNGELLTEDGQELLIDGRRVIVRSDGVVIDAITKQPITTANGEQIKFDPLKGLISASGQPLNLHGRITLPDGTLVSSKGLRLIGMNGNSLSLSKNGHILDIFGGEITIDGYRVVSSNQGPIKYNSVNEVVIDDANKPAIFNLDNGITSNNYRPSVLIGRIKDSRGHLIGTKGGRFEAFLDLKNKLRVANNTEILSEDNLPITIRGSKVKLLADKRVVSTNDDTTILDDNKRAVFFSIKDGLFTQIGKISLDGGILNASKQNINHKGYIIDEDRRISWLGLSNDGTIIGIDLMPVKIDNKEIKSLSDMRVVFSTTNNDVLDLDKRPVFFSIKKGLVLSLERPSNLIGRITDSLGNFIDTHGLQVHEIDMGKSDIKLSVDRTLLDYQGKQIFIFDMPVKARLDSVIIDLDTTNPTTDTLQAIVYFDQTLGLVNLNKISAALVGHIKNSDGQLLSVKGRPLVENGSAPAQFSIGIGGVIRGTDNKEITINGRKVKVLANGRVVDAVTGQEVLDANKEAILYFPQQGFVTENGAPSALNGHLKDSSNNPLSTKGSIFQPINGITSKLSVSKDGMLLDSNNEPLTINGHVARVRADGVVVDAVTGEPILDENNQQITFDQLSGLSSNKSKLSISDSGLVLDATNKPFQINGRNVRVRTDGVVVDAITGDPILGDNGDPLTFEQLTGMSSSTLGGLSFKDLILNSKNEPVSSKGSLLLESGGPANLLSLDRDRTVVDVDLKPITIRMKMVKVTRDSNVVDYLTDNAVLDLESQPVTFAQLKGLVNNLGAPSYLQGILRDSKGRPISSRGNRLEELATTDTVVSLAELDVSDAVARALANKGRNIKSPDLTDTGSQNDRSASTRTSEAKLGNFIVKDNVLLSIEREPLLLDSASVKIDGLVITSKPGAPIRFDQTSMKFVGESTPSIIFTGSISGKIYDAAGIELITSNSMYVNEKSELLNGKGYMLRKGIKLIVNDESLVNDETGKPLRDIFGETVMFTPKVGFVSNSGKENAAIDGIVTDSSFHVVDYAGVPLVEQAGLYFKFGSLPSIRALKNQIITREHSPIYDASGKQLRVQRGDKLLLISNFDGESFKGLKVKTGENGDLVWYDDKNPQLDPTEIIVFNHLGQPTPLVKNSVDFELKGSGLFVALNKQVYSDSNAEKAVSNSKGELFKFINGQLVGPDARPIAAIGKIASSNDNGTNYAINIDGGFIYNKGMKVTNNEWNDLKIDALNLFGPKELYKQYSLSDKGYIYNQGVPLKSVLALPVYYDKATQEIKTGSTTDGMALSPALLQSFNNMYLYSNSLIVSNKNILLTNDHVMQNGRFITKAGTVLLERMQTLVSFDTPLISDGELININFLTPTSRIGDVLVYGDLLVSKNGELLTFNGDQLALNSDSQIVNALTREGIVSSTGKVFLDRLHGFVNEQGKIARVDYITTKSGDLITNDGTTIKPGEMRQYKLSHFLIDDKNRVYTKDSKPVILGNAHIAVDSNGNIEAAGKLLTTGDGENLKLGNEKIETTSGDDFGVLRNGTVSKSDDGIFGGLFNSLFSQTKNGLDIISDGITARSINKVMNEDVTQFATPKEPNDDAYTANDQEALTTSNEKEVATSNNWDTPTESVTSNTSSKTIRGSASIINGIESAQFAQLKVQIDAIRALTNKKWTLNASEIGVASNSGTSNTPNGKGPSNITNSQDVTNADKAVVTADLATAKTTLPLAQVVRPPEDAVLLFQRKTVVETVVENPYSTGTYNGVGGLKPILRILTGELEGSTLVPSSIEPTFDDLVLSFNSVTLPSGVVITTDQTFGVSINSESGLAGSGSTVDNHIWDRIKILAPLAWFTKAGQWIEAKSTATSTSITGTETTQVVNPPTASEVGMIMAGEAANTTKEIFTQSLDALVKEYKLQRGQRIQVIIVQDVYIREDDLYQY